MDIFNKSISVTKALLFLLILVVIILGYFFINSEGTGKWSSILSGLVTGFVMVLFQFILSWYEFRRVDKFNGMFVKDILVSRDSREFYAKLINNADFRIKIMGVTADRFLNDFADENSTQDDRKILFAALDRNVKVKIILPEKDYLENETQKQDYENVKSNFEKIKSKYQDKFEYKYFKHTPSHSIFVVDDHCLLGPVFPRISSKDTPTIFFKNKSPYAKKYLAYFKSEWDNN